MKSMGFSIKVLIVVRGFFAVAMLPAQIVSYPAPEGMPLNDDFSVRVRAPGGQWQDLFEYTAQVDMHKMRDTSIHVTRAGLSALRVKRRPEFAKFGEAFAPLAI